MGENDYFMGEVRWLEEALDFFINVLVYGILDLGNMLDNNVCVLVLCFI